MARTLEDKLATLEPARRARVGAEAVRLHTEFRALKELRKARALTQVQLAETLQVQQTTVAKYERQSDLLLSTLTSYVQAMGGSLKLVVEFPGTGAVELRGIGETDAPMQAPAE